MILKRFIQKYIGQRVDFDGSFGCHCVDLYRQYCKDVLEIPQTPSVDGARDIWTNHGVLKQCQALGPGDVLIYDRTPSNKYGHICILVSIIDTDTFVVLEQDGFKQDGVKLAIRERLGLLGGLYV